MRAQNRCLIFDSIVEIPEAKLTTYLYIKLWKIFYLLSNPMTPNSLFTGLKLKTDWHFKYHFLIFYGN